MSDFTLVARPALGGFHHEEAGLTVSELSDFSLVSVAVPLGGDKALAGGLRSGLGLARPDAGASTVSSDGKHRLLWTAPDQMLLMSIPGLSRPVEDIRGALDVPAYLTDQSDAWTALRLAGPRTVDMLQRMVPIDTAPESFGPGRVARTVTEYMGVIVLREEGGDILLLAARSSAQTFLHAITTTVGYVAAE